MYKSLNAPMVGIHADVSETIELAAQNGFGGVDLALRGHAERFEAGADRLRQAMAAVGVRAGCCSLLPGTVSVAQEEWDAGVAELPRLAALAARLGFTRAGVVVLPFHETLAFDEAFDLHVTRLRQAAPVLADHGLSLGCEYVSQLTRRAPYEHHFVHDMKGMLELCRATGCDNVALLFDTFHWHCAGETLDDVEALKAEQIVCVHVADAPAGRTLDEHVAFERAMPGQTGVIDLKGLSHVLEAIDYNGPLTCEPFVKLTDLPPGEAAQEGSAALDTMLAD